MAEVAVAGGLFVLGFTKIQPLDDPVWREAVAGDWLLHAVYGDGCFQRLVVADGVGQVAEYFLGLAFSQILYSNAASGVGGGAVNFAGVFAAEAATTDWYARAVIINHELAAGQAGVGVKAALIPVAGRVYVQEGRL